MNYSTTKIKIAFILFFAFGASVFFWMTIYRLLTPSRAVGEIVSVNFIPSSGDIKAGEQSSAEIIFTAPDNKGIAGVDINVKATNVKLIKVDNAQPVDGGAVFTNISSQLATDGSWATQTSFAVEPDEKLPQSARLGVKFQCIKQGVSTLEINRARSEVVGNINGHNYELGTLGKATFNCKGDGDQEEGDEDGPTPPTGPNINVHLVPRAKSVRVGETFTYDLVFDGAPAGKGVSGFDIKLQSSESEEPSIEVVKISELLTGSVSQDNINTLSSPGGGVSLLDNSCQTDADCKTKGFCADLTGTVCLPCVNGFCGGANPGVTGSASPQPTDEPVLPVPPDEAPNPNETKLPDDIPRDDDQKEPPNKPISPVPTEVPAPTQCTKLVKEWNNNTGEIQLAYACLVPQNQLPINPHFTITLKAKKKGSGSLSMIKARVLGNIPGDIYRVNRGGATYTVFGPDDDISPPEGAVRLNLKMRFQGVYGKPVEAFNKFDVKCTLKNDKLSRPDVATARFTADEKGVWIGDTMSFKAEAGSGYTLLCKGPKHIQKRFCVARPTETYPGTYSCDRGKITLEEGINELDLTGVHQLVGDLPDQDGIVNSYDTSLCRNLLGKEDPESQRLADLNGDSVVNAIDCALVTAALSNKLDDQ